VADAAKSPSAGVQKWVLTNGTWNRVYVLQNGLNLGQQYSVPNYPTSLNPATDGLRNLTGKVNSDGTVTIWAVTSTVSANGDQGADPNKLVSITDTLANTDPTVAAKEQFTTVLSAPAGQVLRGVSLTPTAGSSPAQNAPLILSAASSQVESVAPGGLAFAFGQALAAGNPPEILGPAPTELNGTSISIKDSTGATTAAPLLFVSPWQLTFQIPSTVAAGAAQVTVTSTASTQAVSSVQVSSVAPAIFSLNGLGLAAAFATRVSNGTQITEPAYTLNSFGTFIAKPISMGSGSDQTYLTLYGTGIQAAGQKNVSVTVNGVNAPVLYAGSGGFTGVDQVNVQLPASLAGTGNVNVQVTAGGTLANQVQITIQ
jgi:uncharacterized protein (TIGR03437 family)